MFPHCLLLTLVLCLHVLIACLVFGRVSLALVYVLFECMYGPDMLYEVYRLSFSVGIAIVFGDLLRGLSFKGMLGDKVRNVGSCHNRLLSIYRVFKSKGAIVGRKPRATRSLGASGSGPLLAYVT